MHTLASCILEHATMIWYLEPNFIKDEETYKRKIDSNLFFLESYVKQMTIVINWLKNNEDDRYYPDPDKEDK